jgi:hypothetical protein
VEVEAMWNAIADAAAAESAVWGGALLPEDERRTVPVFSLLAPPELALGVETIYEGYLVHYATPRLFAPPDDDVALLLGDYLYSHGLVRIASTGNVDAVGDLAELIALCAQGRAEDRDGDGPAWAATAARLGRGGLEDARRSLRLDGDPRPLDRVARETAGDDPVDAALAAHVRVVG